MLVHSTRLRIHLATQLKGLVGELTETHDGVPVSLFGQLVPLQKHAFGVKVRYFPYARGSNSKRRSLGSSLQLIIRHLHPMPLRSMLQCIADKSGGLLGFGITALILFEPCFLLIGRLKHLIREICQLTRSLHILDMHVVILFLYALIFLNEGFIFFVLSLESKDFFQGLPTEGVRYSAFSISVSLCILRKPLIILGTDVIEVTCSAAYSDRAGTVCLRSCLTVLILTDELLIFGETREVGLELLKVLKGIASPHDIGVRHLKLRSGCRSDFLFRRSCGSRDNISS